MQQAAERCASLRRCLSQGVLGKATAAPEWKEEPEKNIWSDVLTPGAQASKDLEQDYAAMMAVLAAPGFAR